MQPASVDLVLKHAVPNRPTFAQLTRQPGLSFWSVGVGGAKITGAIIRRTAQSARSVPVVQNDIRQETERLNLDRRLSRFNLLADRVAKGTAGGQARPRRLVGRPVRILQRPLFLIGCGRPRRAAQR